MPNETEITNAVLKETIQGLVKLTDERLLNIKETLAEIKTSMGGFATKVELGDAKEEFTKTIQEIRDGFIKHNIDDKESFGGLAKGQAEMRETIKLWMGGLAVLSALISLFSPILLRYWFKF